jgi:hypothetical protein
MKSPRGRIVTLVALVALGFSGTALADSVCSYKSSSVALAVCFSVPVTTAAGASVYIQAWVEARSGNSWGITSGNVAVREGSQQLVSGASGAGSPYGVYYTFQTVGQHVLYARASTVQDSPTITVNVSQNLPAFSNQTATPAISRIGQSVHLTIDVSLYRPAGVLVSYVTPPGGTAVEFARQTVTNGSFTVIAHDVRDFPFVAPYNISGTYQFSAAYLGDALNSAAQSAYRTVSVGPFPTSTTLSQSSTTSQGGTAFTLNAGVTGALSGVPAPGGNIEFFDGTRLLSAVAINAQGTAALTVTQIQGTGSHSLTARYAGDANYQASTSSAVAHAITFNPAVLVPIIEGLLDDPAPH